MAKTAKEVALKILKEDFVGSMATIRGDKPRSRYMTFFNDEFTLYTVTGKDTYKVDDLQANPNTHILLGYEGKGMGDAYLEIEGIFEESKEETLKEKVFERAAKVLDKTTKLSDLVVLKITPQQIRLLNKKGEEPQNVDF